MNNYDLEFNYTMKSEKLYLFVFHETFKSGESVLMIMKIF
jgi:hypothetical protein